MLAREDKKRLPIGLIPTGQSNDTARSLGIPLDDVVKAIDHIKKGEAIAVDTTRVLLDHDSESSVPEGDFRLNFCRHMLSNASLSMPAKITNSSSTWKGCCGSGGAFSFTTYL